MTYRSTPDPRENFANNSSAEPGVPSYALQALMSEREHTTATHPTQPAEGAQDASGGLVNIAQFAEHDLSHLGHLRAVGTRLALGQSPSEAVQGHIDLITGMYRAPEDPNLGHREPQTQ